MKKKGGSGIFFRRIIDLEKFLEGYTPDPELNCVMICFQFPMGKTDSEVVFDALMKYEAILRELVEIENLGHVDGHEFCHSPTEESITYFIYGKDADAIHAVIADTIEYIPFLPGSYILKQYDGLHEEVTKILL